MDVDVKESKPESQKVDLYKHQTDGVHFIARARLDGHGIGLFDEMGLGKTLTIIAALYAFWRTIHKGSTERPLYLAIVPLAVLDAWLATVEMCNAEFAQHTAVFHGDMSFNDFLKKHPGVVFVITTPGKVLSEKKKNKSQMFSMLWDSVILDEADEHRNVVKAPKGKGSQTYRKKEAEDRKMDVDEEKKKKKKKEKNVTAEAIFSLKRLFGYALTGTPINNDIYDLASLALFLNHGPASGALNGSSSSTSSTTWLQAPPAPSTMACTEWWYANEHNDDNLLAWCNKYCLRRLAESTLKPKLPPLRQHAVCLNMSPVQVKIHELLIKKCEEAIDKKEKNTFTLIQRLQQNANSPYALPRQVIKDLHMEEELGLESKLSNGNNGENTDATIQNLVAHSPKLQAIFQDVSRQAEKPAGQRRKMVIFAQHTVFLRLIERVVTVAMSPVAKARPSSSSSSSAMSLEPDEVKPLVYDGSMAAKARNAAIAEFQSSTNTDNFVMLVSTHAGNIGITLHAATIAIVADVSFNPVDSQQAICRLHRIGQKQPVDAYSLITKEDWSIEQWMLSIVQRKVEIAARVISGVSKQMPLFSKLSGGRSTGRGYTFVDFRNLVRLNKEHRAEVAREKKRKEDIRAQKKRVGMKTQPERKQTCSATSKKRPLSPSLTKTLDKKKPIPKKKKTQFFGEYGYSSITPVVAKPPVSARQTLFESSRFKQAPKMINFPQGKTVKQRIMMKLDKMSKK